MREPGKWRQKWRGSVSFETKAGILLLGILCLGIAGWFAASQLTSAKATGGGAATSDGASGTRVVLRTVVRRVTVVTPGRPKVVVRTVAVPVVRNKTKTTAAANVTVVRTTTVVAPARVETRIQDVTTSVAVPVTVTRSVTERVTTVDWRSVTVVQRPPPVTVTVTTPTP